MDQPDGDQRDELDAKIERALDELWVRFLPDIEDRVKVLAGAAAALCAGDFAPESRVAAESAAHKLAGILGTFNLNRGTELAREFEATVAPNAQLDPNSGERLSWIVREIRTMMENRKPGMENRKPGA
jgi:HPt (histidine-containing phosphotransfer) domain-containing protein